MRLSFFALALIISVPASALTPDSGWWWNADESGRGFNIEVQNDVLVISTYTYDSSGDSVWYLAAGSLTGDGSEFEGTFEAYANGQCPDCAYRSPDSLGTVGDVTISFSSQNKAIMDWQGVSTDIVRYNFGFGQSPESMLGTWVFTYEKDDEQLAKKFTFVDADPDDTSTEDGSGTGLFRTVDDDARGECYQSGTLEGTCILSEVPGTGGYFLYEQGLGQVAGAWIDSDVFFPMQGWQVESSNSVVTSAVNSEKELSAEGQNNAASDAVKRLLNKVRE